MAGEDCPVCRSGVAKVHGVGPLEQEILVDCPTCGVFALTDLAQAAISKKIIAPNDLSAVLGYYFRRMQGESAGGRRPKITEEMVNDFLKRDLPSAAELANNLILWLGDRTKVGSHLRVVAQEVYTHVGANRREGLLYIINALCNTGLLERTGELADLCLSFAGWTKYEELKKGHSTGKKAFMAMGYGNAKLDLVYANFQPAVKAAGFNLVRLDERPEAGLIDNRLRVEIQTSRFLVVELTDDNRGAYWEGGFAEGLGKPVFYSCEKTHFDKRQVHFDANHLYTVVWELEKLDKASAELKNAIRATLPDEAKMMDD